MRHTTLLTKLTEYGEAHNWALSQALREEVILLFEDIRAKELSLILDQKVEIGALKEKVNELQQQCRKRSRK